MAMDDQQRSETTDKPVNKPSGRSGRGFASMDPEQQRAIARQGGRAAHASGNAHQFTSEEARAAGRKSHSGRVRAAADAAGASGTSAGEPAGRPTAQGSESQRPAQQPASPSGGSGGQEPALRPEDR